MDATATTVSINGTIGSATLEVPASINESTGEAIPNNANPATDICNTNPAILTAENVTTPAELAALKKRHAELKDDLETAHREEREARQQREAQPGFNIWDEIHAYQEHYKRSAAIMDEIYQMKLPTPNPLQWALIELSVDFKLSHYTGENKLAKFDVDPGREWFNDDGKLVTRLKVYILMRFGASKSVNEDGNAKYMSLESIHNLWTMCRHLINHYQSLERYEKGRATQAFTALTTRLLHKYKIRSANKLALPGISDLPPWTDYWDTFPEDVTLRDLCEFDLSTNINGGDSQTANVTDGALTVHISPLGVHATWKPLDDAAHSADTA